MKSLISLQILLSVAIIVALTACGSQNPDLQAQVLGTEVATQSGEKLQDVQEPKVDILFVVDNSGSMDAYQDKMAKNVELFANEFFDSTRINYRIGVVPIYDSDYLNDHTIYRSGPRKMNPLGELVELKGVPNNPNGKKNLYITRDTPNPKEVLKQTVVLGTQWGPEAEQSFSPVLTVAGDRLDQLGVTDSQLKELKDKNDSFYEKDAYLAVILLTDADDVTPGLSGFDFYERLKALKGGDGSKVLIAAAIPRTCPSKDAPGPVKSIPDLINASGGMIADLCSDRFGAQLAQFGRFLVQRVAQRKVHLDFEPDISTMIVTHAPPGTPREERMKNIIDPKDYRYDPVNRNVVLLNSKYPMPHDHVIYVEADKVNESKRHNGRVKTI